MKRISIFLIILISALIANSQQEMSNKDLQEYKSQVNQMVTFLQETLNFIGDPRNSAHEKDIIFKESYTKIFRDENVQVEDDLDDNRGTSINKDVQAYLKDIDFFFDDVNFSFDIQSITPQINELGESFFKVAMVRTLSGRSITGDTIVNTKNRFLEINLDAYKKELKIVSFYTTKPNVKEELYTWWNSMSKPWKDYLGSKFYVYDSIEMNQINLILSDAYTTLIPSKFILQDSFMIVGNDTMTMDRIDELYGHSPDTIVFINDTVTRWINDTVKVDLSPIYETLQQMIKTTAVDVSDNIAISDLNPLSELSDLNYLNCAGTEVSSIDPIRNLNNIKELNISNTNITDLSNLKYANVVKDLKADNTGINDISIVEFFKDINYLSISNTDVSDISSLSKCENLNTLNISGTQINNLSPLTNITKLYHLDASNTFINDLSPLKNIECLYYLNLEASQVTDLTCLNNLKSLNELNISNTKVTSLDALNGMSHLNKIYCDNSLITKEIAQQYKRSNPNVLVINESNALTLWWNELPSFWKTLLTNHTNTTINPTKEELHSIINIRSLKVDPFIHDAEPISRLTSLETLDISDSKIDDLTPLSNLHNLKSLNIKNTIVSDLAPLSNCNNLREINIENTKVSSLQTLHQINSLGKIYADGTKLSTEEVNNLKKVNRQVSVIYQTEDLRQWWGNLDGTWRDIFNTHLLCNSNPTPEQLQNIIDIEEITIEPNYVVYSLEPLSQMTFITKLVVNNNQIQDLSPLSDKSYLEVLSVSGNPVGDIIPLTNLYSLRSLNLENTPVSDLNPIANLKNIKVLNIGGTSVRNLKPIANYNSLEDLSIVNTDIKNLTALENLQSLKHLKAYKTKVKEKYINLLKQLHPDLNVIYY